MERAATHLTHSQYERMVTALEHKDPNGHNDTASDQKRKKGFVKAP
jgi:hypothetical protein